ncbi:E3 ubiquitin-protein ligase TRIM71 [Geodia barretti]|uniref:E3 ubiquitin-protein ligase TRIM71 n=1 Tax=Geodia barretti TaxID=519541 RepID=A0AA35TT39_GEOBA|nr:E3 ubiquitin-protein ligase TRIM71 [Geodia barretti]
MFYCRSHNHLTCPKCRDVTVLSELGVDALPINWDLMQVVDIIGEEADESLLDANSFTSHHSSSPLTSLLPMAHSDNMPMCREHNRRLDYFCEKCDVLVCATCAINTHGGHKPKEAQKLTTELRSQCVDPLEIRYLRTNVAIDENTRIYNQVRKLGESHKHRIQTLFQELRNTLNSRELALVQSLEGVISKKCSALHTQCMQLQQLREKLNAERESVSRLLQIKDHDYTVLLKRKQIAAEVDAVVNEVDGLERDPVEKLEDGPECVLREELLQEASGFGEIYCTPTPAKFVASGPGLEKGLQVGKEAEFVVEAHDKYGQRAFKGGNKVEVKILDPQGAEIPVAIDNAKRGRSLVRYTPKKVGFHVVTILVDSQRISNYQWNVMVYGYRDYSVMTKPRLYLSRQQISDMSTVKSVCVLPLSGYLAFSDQLCIRTVNLEGLRLVKRAIGLAGSPSGLFSMPIGITANSKDELFIADRQACKITKLAPDGRVVGSYGRQGRGSGGLRHPESVAVTTDRLFVVDTGNNCIQAMSLKSGKFKVIGGRGVPDGIQLREPQGVAVDEVRGRLYITDAGYNCLLCVSLATLEPSLPSGRAGTVL